MVHCFFEQSGTFRDEFRKLGYDAIDYDILNDYGTTDKIIDLFEQIRGGYEGKPSIFDDISPDDLVMAFFPCTMFQENNQLIFSGNGYQQITSTDKMKLEVCIKRHKTLHEYYTLLSMLCVIAIDRGFKLIIENPYTQPHYLNIYWCLKPKVIDKNRQLNGDYYKKPTQYWFINCEPKNNIVFRALDYVEPRTVDGQKGKDRQRLRSEIHPQYARRFIEQYILDVENNIVL